MFLHGMMTFTSQFYSSFIFSEEKSLLQCLDAARYHKISQLQSDNRFVTTQEDDLAITLLRQLTNLEYYPPSLMEFDFTRSMCNTNAQFLGLVVFPIYNLERTNSVRYFVCYFLLEK